MHLPHRCPSGTTKKNPLRACSRATVARKRARCRACPWLGIRFLAVVAFCFPVVWWPSTICDVRTGQFGFLRCTTSRPENVACCLFVCPHVSLRTARPERREDAASFRAASSRGRCRCHFPRGARRNSVKRWTFPRRLAARRHSGARRPVSFQCLRRDAKFWVVTMRTVDTLDCK